MRAFKTLFLTELKLSLRAMDMVIFALCMPLAVVVILGGIFGGRPAFDGADYTFLEQSFGAVSAIAICAGGVMGLPLIISDYRSKKILKRFKVTPTSPATLLFTQVLIYAVYALLSMVLVYAASALLFGMRFRGSVPAFLGAYLLVMVSMFSIGILVGGLAKDYRSAGMLASLLYFPMLGVFPRAVVSRRDHDPDKNLHRRGWHPVLFRLYVYFRGGDHRCNRDRRNSKSRTRVLSHSEFEQILAEGDSHPRNFTDADVLLRGRHRVHLLPVLIKKAIREEPKK